MNTALRIKDAKRDLKRGGTSHASGDALRYMYANMLPFHCRTAALSNKKIYKKQIEIIFTHFLQFSTDDTIGKEGQRLLQTPLDCCEIIFGDLPKD